MKSVLLSPWVLELIGEVWTALTPLLAVWVAIYLRKAYLHWCKVRGVQANESALRQLDKAAELAIGGVEEYTRLAAKQGLALRSTEKLDQAVKIVRELALDDLRAFSDEQLRTAIEAKLPEMRVRLSSAPPPGP